MDFTTIGSLNRYTKNLRMQTQWNRKRASGDITRHTDSLSDQLKQRKTEAASVYQQQIDQERENEDSDKLKQIMEKVYSGKKLTQSERQYLQTKDPRTYQQLQSTEQEQKSYEQELKRCRTKEEVQRLKMSHLNNALTTVKSVANNPNIPEDKKREIIAIEKLRSDKIASSTRTFVKRGDYEKLPTEAEKARVEEEQRKAEAEEKKIPEGDHEQTARIDQMKESKAFKQSGKTDTGKETELDEKATLSENRTEDTAKRADDKAHDSRAIESPEERKVRHAKAKAAYAAVLGMTEDASGMDVQA